MRRPACRSSACTARTASPSRRTWKGSTSWSTTSRTSGRGSTHTSPRSGWCSRRRRRRTRTSSCSIVPIRSAAAPSRGRSGTTSSPRSSPIMPLPVRHGMTVGELARLYNAERKIGATLEVIPCTGWSRDDFYDRTGLVWINPSPNMRSLTEALIYPGRRAAGGDEPGDRPGHGYALRAGRGPLDRPAAVRRRPQCRGRTRGPVRADRFHADPAPVRGHPVRGRLHHRRGLVAVRPTPTGNHHGRAAPCSLSPRVEARGIAPPTRRPGDLSGHPRREVRGCDHGPVGGGAERVSAGSASDICSIAEDRAPWRPSQYGALSVF